MSKTKSVAVVGAGACGLVCAKILLDDGFDVTLFDRQRELGGIWCAESAYANLHSQQPGGTFEFADLLDGGEYPSWQKVHNYLQSYADLFHITERIRFQTRVISIHKDDIKDDTIPWIIKIETIDGQYETFEFDLVVIATGLFSEQRKPNFRGQQKFCGPIVQPFSVKSHEQVENKRVIVVGGGKCATDLAVLAGRFARSCHLVFRKAHWTVPRKIIGGRLPLRFLLSRAFCIPFTPFPDAPHTALFSFLHRTFPSLFLKLTNIISADILAIYGPDFADDKIFIPQHSFKNLETISVLPDEFISLKKQGRIIGKLASIDEIINETTIRLDSGEELQADMIICATGFIQRFPFFSEKHAQMIGLINTPDGDTKINLYHRLIPVGIPNIGFIGFTGSLDHWMIAEVASHWLSDYFLNRLELPSEKIMHEEIERRNEFLQNTFRTNGFQYAYYWAGPIDMDLKDMGLSLYRTNNWISEYFDIYRPERFKGLHEERRIKAEKGIRPRHWYFSFEYTMFLILLLICIFFIFK